MKRVFDTVVSLIVLTVLSPLLLLIGVVLLSSSGHPVFFLQERAGSHGRLFHIIKFRSMTRDAEERIHGQFIAADNPYVTPIGRFLRRTSLDELPEFVNVLKGAMSLVGPRPQVSEVAAEYNEFQRRRLSETGDHGVGAGQRAQQHFMDRAFQTGRLVHRPLDTVAGHPHTAYDDWPGIATTWLGRTAA